MKKQAFSLMEMMVVMLIVAVVAAVSAPMISKKMLHQQAIGNSSPWMWIGNDAVYNEDGNNWTAYIGATGHNGDTHPLLYLSSDSSNRPHITLGSGRNPLYHIFASDNGGISITNGTTAPGENAVALGPNVTANYSNAIAIGQGAVAKAKEAIAIGGLGHVGHWVDERYYDHHYRITMEDPIEFTATNTYGTRETKTPQPFNKTFRDQIESNPTLWIDQNNAGTYKAGTSNTREAIDQAFGQMMSELSAWRNSHYGWTITPDITHFSQNSPKWHVEVTSTPGNPKKKWVSQDITTEAAGEDSVAIGYGARTNTSYEIVLGTEAHNVRIPGTMEVAGELKALKLTNTSDRRLKNVGETFQAGLDEIKKLEVFNYILKDDKDKTPRVGVMAQDLQKIFPNAVTTGSDGFLRIRMEDMFYAMVNAIKQLDEKIENIINNEIVALTKRVNELEKQNAELAKQNVELVKQNADFEKRLVELEKKIDKKTK